MYRSAPSVGALVWPCDALIVAGTDGPTMTATRVRWGPNDREIFFVDTDHGADVPPVLMRLDIGRGPQSPHEMRLADPGEALDLLLNGHRACVLYRRARDSHYVVEGLDLSMGIRRTLTSTPNPITLLG